MTTVASPRMMSNSPLASLAKQQGINFNPKGTQGMLQYAANKPQNAAESEAGAEATGENNNDEINIANFRTHKQDQADRRNREQEM